MVPIATVITVSLPNNNGIDLAIPQQHEEAKIRTPNFLHGTISENLHSNSLEYLVSRYIQAKITVKRVERAAP